MTPDASSRVGYGAALQSGQFRALFFARLVSVGGTSVAAVALTVLVYLRTTSPLLSSLTFTVGFIPYVVGGGLLSSAVDRLPPRRLLVGCNVASALVVVTVAWPGIPVPLVLALLLAIGTSSSLANGAIATLIRSIVPADAYVPASSLMRITAQVAQIVGNAGGGALLLLVSPGGALLINAMAYAIAALLVRICVVHRPVPSPDRRQSLLRDSVIGARSVFSHPRLRRLFLVGWLTPMFAVAPEALAAPYVVSHHAPPALVGWWLIALPVGSILGDVIGVRMFTASQRRRIMTPAIMASFLPYLAFALGPSVQLAVALIFASGLCWLYMLGLDSYIRAETPPELFARAMTMYSAGLMALQGLGFALAGATAEGLGPAWAIAAWGAVGFVTSCIVLLPRMASERLGVRT